MANYEVSASPFFYNVTCPKHRERMQELKNGFIGEKVWWCSQCERPYELSPKLMPKGTFDIEEIKKQLMVKEK